MVDNVLLEKRNRYLGKLIKKTQNLTESVKLLSIIDKELYSQSGGTFTQVIEKLRNPVVVHTSESDSLTDLKNVVNQLQETIKNFSNFEQKLQKMAQPVVYVEPPTNLIEIKTIIDQIQQNVGVLDKHEIIIITNFLTDEPFNNAANKYAESAIAYNKNQIQETQKKLIETWRALELAYNNYKTKEENKQNNAILEAVFDWMYKKPPFNDSAPSRIGSSSSVQPATGAEASPGSKGEKDTPPSSLKKSPIELPITIGRKS
jgi:hypothetical protein